MRTARFLGVGLVGFVLQLTVVHVLTKAGVNAGVAVAAGVELAILQNFAWHERWTWHDRRGSNLLEVLRRLIRFNAASGAVSIIGNVAVTLFLATTLRLPLLAANVAAVAALSAANYVVADRYVFRRRDHSFRNETIGSIRDARRAGT